MEQLDQSYRILSAQNTPSDYGLSRKYGGLLGFISRNMNHDMHQLLYTDDVNRIVRLLASYFIHVDSMRDGRLSEVAKAGIRISASLEEVAESEVNPEKFRPRVFTNVIAFRLDHSGYSEWAKRIWQYHTAPMLYEKSDGQFDASPFTDPELGPATIKAFEKSQSNTLFLNDVGDRAKNPKFVQGLLRGLLTQKVYGNDHRDYVEKIPKVVWILPISSYFDISSRFDEFGYISGYMPLTQHVVLLQDFDKWRGVVNALLGEHSPQDERVAIYLQAITQRSLELIAQKVKNKFKEYQKHQNIKEFFGISDQELKTLQDALLET